MEATDEQPGGGEVAGNPPPPTLTVAAVARRLGVAPPTLRTWDRRYGLGPSAHTAGAHRRYSPSDVARLMVMRRLTLQGVPPADAARYALATQGAAADAAMTSITPMGQGNPAETTPSRPDGEETPPGGVSRSSVLDDVPAGGRRPDPEVEDVSDPFSDADLSSARRAGLGDEAEPPDLEDEVDDLLEGPWRDEPGSAVGTPWLGVLRSAGSDRVGADHVGDARGESRSPAGGGRVVALPYGSPAARGLARAAMSLDTLQTARLLRDAIRRDGVVATWEDMATPVLRALGERTSATGDGIDVEHALSEVLLSVLRGVAIGVRQPRNPAPILLTCVEGDYHSLPLHVLSAALGERDIDSRMLGAGLPPAAIAAAVRRTGPSAVVVYAQMPGADASSVEQLRRQRPTPRVVLGGPGWVTSTIPSSARVVNSLAEALDEVLLAVHV
jgi:DNA-binding transcriptional MerR regulator